jgi:NhaP-type Na+/H+ and K+/H+ antiporter
VVEVDVVGGITGLILGVLVTTQVRAVVLTWASVGLDLAYSLLIGSVVGRTPHSRADSVPPTEALRGT